LSATVAGQGGDFHLVDELTEEGGLGQYLDVEKRGDRLERDRLQLLEAMGPDRRMDVAHRDGEYKPPCQALQPAKHSRGQICQTTADDVVALIDRLEQGVEMGVRGGRDRRSHDDHGA